MATFGKCILAGAAKESVRIWPERLVHLAQLRTDLAASLRFPKQRWLRSILRQLISAVCANNRSRSPADRLQENRKHYPEAIKALGISDPVNGKRDKERTENEAQCSSNQDISDIQVLVVDSGLVLRRRLRVRANANPVVHRCH